VVAALALALTAAHLMELPHKIGLAGAEYLVVQRLYRGWQYAGIVVVGALISLAVLSYLLPPAARLRLRAVRAAVRRRYAGRLLELHVSGEPGNRELARAAGELDAVAQPLGVLARRQRGVQHPGVAGRDHDRGQRALRFGADATGQHRNKSEDRDRCGHQHTGRSRSAAPSRTASRTLRPLSRRQRWPRKSEHRDKWKLCFINPG